MVKSGSSGIGARGAREGREERGSNDVMRPTVNGSDLTESWTRRKKEFDSAFEDIVDAQGFDGKPSLVGRERFNEIVAETGIVLGRGYGAADQKTLDKYREQFYNGDDWYFGGAGRRSYGDGMYTFASMNGDIKEAEEQSKVYATPSKRKGTTVGYGEVMTLSSDARIANYDNELEMRQKVRQSVGEERWREIRSDANGTTLAAMLGYDAVYVPDRDIMVVLNRSKLIIRK